MFFRDNLLVDGAEVLDKISSFTLTSWNYKGQNPLTSRHYGPMAQDFHSAFGQDAIGKIGNDRLINQQDFLGINLIAIQALEKRTQQIKELYVANALLATNNQELNSRVSQLETANTHLTKKMEDLISKIEAFSSKFEQHK